MYEIGEYFGYGAVLAGLFLYVSKSRKTISLAKIVGECLWIISYFFCSLYLLCVLSIIALIRQIIFHFRTSKKWADKKYWLYMFLALTLVSPAIEFSINGWANLTLGAFVLALLPPIGSVFNVYGYYSKSALYAKFRITPGVLLYLIYSIGVWNIPSMIGNILSVISLVIGFTNEYIKYKRNKKLEILEKVETEND